MINIEDLKPILQDLIAEDAMPDAVLRVSAIDKEMDDTALKEAQAEIEKLRKQNKDLANIFFTGKDNANQNPLPDVPAEPDSEDEDKDETFEGLFEEKEYNKREVE